MVSSGTAIRLGVLSRHNTALMLREPGPVVSRLVMPLVMILLFRPLYLLALARHGVQAGTVQVVTGMLAAQQAEVLLFGVVVFGLRVADPFLLAVAVISWALALLGIGTALGATLRSQSELNMAYDIGGVVLSALGGALIPLSVLPDWARAAAPASPGYWAMSALRSALQGQAGATLRAAAVLLAVAAVTAALGTWRMTRGWSRSRSL